jgi:hypothetical protein
MTESFSMKTQRKRQIAVQVEQQCNFYRVIKENLDLSYKGNERAPVEATAALSSRRIKQKFHHGLENTSPQQSHPFNS